MMNGCFTASDFEPVVGNSNHAGHEIHFANLVVGTDKINPKSKISNP